MVGGGGGKRGWGWGRWGAFTSWNKKPPKRDKSREVLAVLTVYDCGEVLGCGIVGWEFQIEPN